MEKVVGIGGLFFRAHEPEVLAQWYLDKLGIDLVPNDYGGTPWHQEAGPTVFAPFPQDTTYFGPQDNAFMINFRVRDLDRIVEQLRSEGIPIEVDPENYPNGRFARLYDPEGNAIELWQPEMPTT